MKGLTLRWIGRMVMAAAVAAVPSAAVAQVVPGAPSGLQLPRLLNAATGDESAALVGQAATSVTPQRSTRRRNVWIGAGIGAAGGVVLGELWLGQGLGVSHGPDMLLGAGIGAGAGAIVGALISRSAPKAAPAGTKTRGSVVVVPHVSRSRQAVLVNISLK